jgi:hypothetical protein
MTSLRLERAAGGAGILAALLAATYVLTPPHDPSYPYTAGAIHSLAANHTAYLARNLLGTLSFGFFLIFLGSLYSTLRCAEAGTGWLSTLTLGSGLILVAVHSIETVMSYALGWHVAQQGNMATVTALEDISSTVAYYYAVPLALMLVTASTVMYATRVLPRWIAWLGFAAGAAWLIGSIGVLDPQNGPLTAIGFGGGLVLYFLVWMPATSIALMRRSATAEETRIPLAAGTANAH